MMIDSRLINCCDFPNLNEFSLCCPFQKRSKYSGFFLDAHISMVSTIVVARDCFQSVVSVFSNKTSYIRGMKSCFFCNVIRALAFSSEFQRL